MKLKNQVALVTGAARGLGLIIAKDLAREGVHLCGTDIRAELLTTEMARLAKDYGVQTLPIDTNVAVEPQVKAAVEQVFARWGRVDILVNNAGVRKVARVSEITAAIWDEMHSVNLKGQFLFTREVLK